MKRPAARRDKRFAGREWRDSGYHDYLRQVYLLNSRFLNDLVETAEVGPGHVATQGGKGDRQARVRFRAWGTPQVTGK